MCVCICAKPVQIVHAFNNDQQVSYAVNAYIYQMLNKHLGSNIIWFDIKLEYQMTT